MDKFVRHNGAEMFYTVNGEGSPVILMHGWGCSHETVKLIEGVCLLKHKVYNVDFPGFGNSHEPPADQPVWGVEEYTRMIEALAEAESIKDPILIGHSFGGRVAIVYASRHDVDKMVLVDAAGVKNRSLKKYAKIYLFKTGKWLTKLRYFYDVEKARAAIEKRRAKKGSRDYRDASETMKRILSKVVNEDLCHLMPAIKAPTLLIWGKNDTATPLKDAKKMERLIPDAGLVAFDDCGHYSFLENPQAFKAVLNNFVNG